MSNIADLAKATKVASGGPPAENEDNLSGGPSAEDLENSGPSAEDLENGGPGGQPSGAPPEGGPTPEMQDPPASPQGGCSAH